MLVVESIVQYLGQWPRNPDMKLQTDDHSQSAPLPLPHLSTCKMKNNGISVHARNVINALRFLKRLLFSDGNAKI